MVVLASNEPGASVLGTPPADLLLKIVGTARDGQVVRLSNRKCSIGSGPNCTFRLRARGVRPVHCLLLRGPGGTVLRSWAPNTRVNGEVVIEAVLEAGDLVSIGPIEFEVLPSEGPPVDPFDAGRTVVLDRRPAGRQFSQVFATERNNSPLATQPFQIQSQPEQRDKTEQQVHWRTRVRKLVGQVRKLRDQIDRFEQQAPLAEQHAAEAAQLHERLESVKEQNQTWEATLEQLQSELDGRQHQLADELAALGLRRTELDTERRAWQAEHDSLRQAIAQREAAHNDAQLAHQQAQEAWTRETTSREAQLTAAAEALNQQRAELLQLTAGSEEQTNRQAELDQFAVVLDTRNTELDARNTELDARNTELDARSAELDQREADLAAAEVTVRQTEEELANLRAALESQRLAVNEELAEAHRELLATQAEFSAAQQRIAAENAQLAASRDELETHNSWLVDFEAELIVARQALAALYESQEQRLGDRTAELERLAAELAARELELVERLQTTSEASTDTVIVEPNADHLAELQTLRQELAARTAELALAQTAVQQANEIALAASISRETAELDAAQTLASEALAARQHEIESQQAAREEQLAQYEAELTTREATHAAALGAHQQEVAEHQRTVEQHQHALAEFAQSQTGLHALSEELAQREAALISQPNDTSSPLGTTFQPDPAELAALAAQREAVLAAELELERELEELRSDREALSVERESFNQERLRAADRLDLDARELAEAREQLDAEREELEARAHRQPTRSPAPMDDDDDDEEETAAFSEFSPDRRGGRPMFSDEETERPPSLETLRSRQPAEDDDSIESHIAAFMNRLKSGQPVAPPVIERSLPKRRKSDEKPVPTAQEPAEPAEIKSSTPVLDMTTAPMEVARRKAPEGVSSMNVLREIGLTHARSAIDAHGQQRSLNQAYSTLAVSAACLLGAFVVLYLANNAVMRGAGVVILVVAIYWMGSSIWAANKVVATIRRRRKGGLRAMLEEVDAEIAAIRQEAEAELAAAAAEEQVSEVSTIAD